LSFRQHHAFVTGYVLLLVSACSQPSATPAVQVQAFRTCTSSEGGHLVWTGSPLDGQPRWHWYLYAGYDTEYTCTDRDYFGPK